MVAYMRSSVWSCGSCNLSVTRVLLNILFSSSSVRQCLSVLQGTSTSTYKLKYICTISYIHAYHINIYICIILYMYVYQMSIFFYTLRLSLGGMNGSQHECNNCHPI